MAKPDISRKRYFHCYKIICSINGKGYIGIASNGVKTRFNQHKHDAKKGVSTPLHAAIRKYGVENFTIEVLGKTTNWDEICLIEREMILKYDTLTQNGRGYNVSTGGEGPFGVKRSTETKEKLSEITKKWLAEDPDRIQNLIEAGRKQMADPARREQIRKGARDAWKRPDFRKKFSSGKKKWANENRDLLSEQQKRIMARPEMRENLRKKAKAQMNDPSNREISRQGALHQWQNDEFKEKMTMQMKNVSKRNWENPDYRRRMKNISCKPIVAGGQQYPSLEAAAEALGVKANTICTRLKNENFPDYYYLLPKRYLLINGVKYSSVNGAAKILGISNAVCKRRLESEDFPEYHLIDETEIQFDETTNKRQ